MQKAALHGRDGRVRTACLCACPVRLVPSGAGRPPFYGQAFWMSLSVAEMPLSEKE